MEGTGKALNAQMEYVVEVPVKVIEYDSQTVEVVSTLQTHSYDDIYY